MPKPIKGIILGALCLSLCACKAPQGQENHSEEQNAHAAEINVQLGVGYLREGYAERAKHKLLLANRLAPRSPTVLGALGYFYENTGDTEQAELYYRKAYKLSPNSGKSNNNYGAFLCRQGQYAEAQTHFDKAIHDHNYLKVSQAYENAGLCALKAKEVARAKYYFNKAMQNDRHSPNVILELASLALSEKNYQEANMYLNRYLAQTVSPSPRGLLLAYRTASALKLPKKQASYAMMLKTTYPSSTEYKQISKETS